MSAAMVLPGPLASVITRYKGAGREPPQKKKVGRPIKRTPEYLLALLEEHRRVVAWYTQEFGCEPASDRQLYTEYFARHFSTQGERPGRASSQHFQSKLKTLRNELAEARLLGRTNPGNPPISGTAQHVE